MNTKLLAALIVAGILAIAVVGFVAAQVATTSPTPNGTSASANGGFFGWIGRCFGIRGAPYYATTQAPANQSQPITVTVTDPNTNTTTTYQGYPGYGMPFHQGQPENVTVTSPNTGAAASQQGYYGYGCGGMMGFRP